MGLFLGIVATILGVGALATIALFFSCAKAAQREQNERNKGL
jgi:hypothetical protein